MRRRGKASIVEKQAMLAELDATLGELANAKVSEGEEGVHQETQAALQSARQVIDAADATIDRDVLTQVTNALSAVDLNAAPEHSLVAARYAQLAKVVEG